MFVKWGRFRGEDMFWELVLSTIWVPRSNSGSLSDLAASPFTDRAISWLSFIFETRSHVVLDGLELK